LIVGHIPPITASFVRWLGTLLVILPIAWPHLARDRDVIRQNFWVFLGLSIVGFAVPAVLTYWALVYTQALNALLIQSVMPLFIAIWALILFGSRLTPIQAIGIVTSLCGVAVILLRGDMTALSRIEFNKGDVMTIFIVALFGLYSAAISRVPKVHQLSLIAFMAGCCVIWLLPLAVWEVASGVTVIVDVESIAALVFMIVFPSLLSYLFFNRGVQLIGPLRASPFFHLVPVFGSLMAIAFLGEKLQAFHVMGYAAVLAGLYLASRQRSEAVSELH